MADDCLWSDSKFATPGECHVGFFSLTTGLSRQELGILSGSGRGFSVFFSNRGPQAVSCCSELTMLDIQNESQLSVPFA